MSEITPEFIKALAEQVDEIHLRQSVEQENIRDQFGKWLKGIKNYMPHLTHDEAVSYAVYLFNEFCIMIQKENNFLV